MSLHIFKLLYLAAFAVLGLAAVVLHSHALLLLCIVAMAAFIIVIELEQF
jgi:hypothetical protein